MGQAPKLGGNLKWRERFFVAAPPIFLTEETIPEHCFIKKEYSDFNIVFLVNFFLTDMCKNFHCKSISQHILRNTNNFCMNKFDYYDQFISVWRIKCRFWLIQVLND